jgi:arabinoxylan arabinofuranohydrolase
VPGWPKNVIAVAVADHPLGPFKDALGRPLIDKAHGYIDPSPFIDDDGQAYLYWGNPNLWYVKLNRDMISTSGEIVKDPQFAKVKDQPDPYHFQEGPWAYKRGDRYYMAYASTCCPEGIGYAMGDSPTGPWDFKGYIMKPDRRSTGNHPGIVDYKGSTYVFGFNFKLNFAQTKQHHERRSVCVAKMEFNPDGTIRELPWWEEAEAVAQLGALDPYRRVEAETIAWSEGMKSSPAGPGGMCIHPTRADAYIQVKDVDFRAGARAFQASVACAGLDATLELRLDGPEGPLVATLPVGGTGGANRWATHTTTTVAEASGVRDLCLVFTGADASDLHLDWWRFEETPPRLPLPRAASGPRRR